MALAVKRTRREDLANEPDDLRVTLRGLRPALGRLGHRLGAARIDRGARHPPHVAYRPQRVALTHDRTAAAAHFRSLRASPRNPRTPAATPFFAGGCRPSRGPFVWPRFYAGRRRPPPSGGSGPRRFSPCCPPSRNTRRHSSTSCTGTWISRATSSIASPRITRSTTSVFRCALHRSGRSSARCVVIVLSDTVQLLPVQCPEKPRPPHAMIDATHTTPAVKADLAAVQRIISPGGAVLLHDAHYADVKRGIDESLGWIDCGLLTASATLDDEN